MRRGGRFGQWSAAMAAFLLAPLVFAGPPGPRAAVATARENSIGVAEKPGVEIPADVRCLNERGEEFALRSLTDRPVILSLVYYRCEHICPQILVGLGRLASDLDLRPARDYRLITVSFDAGDSPAAAAEAKKNYAAPLGRGFPEAGWTFATASEENIARLTKALGFSFERHPHGFIHPAILVVIMPGGRVSRYIHVSKYNYGVAYPVVFSPVEMKQALLAAANGEVASPAPGPLLFCFPMEPAGQTRFFRLTALAGWITLVLMAGLLTYLIASRKRAKEE